MSQRLSILSALLLLTTACGGASKDTSETKDEAEAAAPAKTETPAEPGADAGAEPAADAADDDSAPAEAEPGADTADEDAARRERIKKGLAELEAWKAEERTRWTPELEAQVTTLVGTKHDSTKAALTEILASPHRLPANVARDPYRHPAQTLSFFGITPQMTVVEIGPGWGWYTEILAPLLAQQGKLVVTDYDPSGPEDQGVTLYARRFEAFRSRSSAAYGKIARIVQKDAETLDLGPDSSADLVLVIRGMHGWVNRGVFDANVAKLHAVLKPGGIVGIVQHRAADDADPKASAEKGYLPQPWVVHALEAAGFKLAEASEINANPRDTTDHPEGVWTLPPTLALGDTDRAKYEAIGESDRMTLRFEKK